MQLNFNVLHKNKKYINNHNFNNNNNNNNNNKDGKFITFFTLEHKNKTNLNSFLYLHKTSKLFLDNLITAKIKKFLYRPYRIFDKRILYSSNKIKRKYNVRRKKETL